MGFFVATLIKANMVRKSIPKMAKAYACSNCNTLGSITVYANRIDIAKCRCSH